MGEKASRDNLRATPHLKEPGHYLHNRLGTVLTLFCPCF
jgi:hypothetical protein